MLPINCNAHHELLLLCRKVKNDNNNNKTITHQKTINKD